MFAGAAVTNYYLLGGLKTTETYSVPVWKPEVRNQGISRARLPLKAPGSFLTSCSFWGLQLFLACGFITPVSASIFMWLSPLLPVSLLWLPFRRTLVAGFRTHPQSRKILTVITPAKNLSPNKATFTGAGGQDLPCLLGATAECSVVSNASRVWLFSSPGVLLAAASSPSAWTPCRTWTITVQTAKLSWAPISVCRTRLSDSPPAPPWGRFCLGGLISPGFHHRVFSWGKYLAKLTSLQTPEIAAWRPARDVQRLSPLSIGSRVFHPPSVTPSQAIQL